MSVGAEVAKDEPSVKKYLTRWQGMAKLQGDGRSRKGVHGGSLNSGGIAMYGHEAKLRTSKCMCAMR